MRVIIFSRPIRSGKTTELRDWSADQPDAQGILMPDIDGKRHFQNVRSGERWPIDDGINSGAIEVGKFRISRTALQKAMAQVCDNESATEWLIIDEIGKLELRDDGFTPLVHKLLARTAQPANLLVVVRDSLLKEVQEKFGWQDARVVHDLKALLPE